MPWSRKEPTSRTVPVIWCAPTSGLTKPADAERCRVVLVFHIDSGEVDGGERPDRGHARRYAPGHGRWQLAGRGVHGRGRQRGASGHVGSCSLGSSEDLWTCRGLIGENLGVEVAPIEYEDEAVATGCE